MKHKAVSVVKKANGYVAQFDPSIFDLLNHILMSLNLKNAVLLP